MEDYVPRLHSVDPQAANPPHQRADIEDWIRLNKADYCIGDNISYADIDTDTFMEFFPEKIKSVNNTRKRTITDESVIYPNIILTSM